MSKDEVPWLHRNSGGGIRTVYLSLTAVVALTRKDCEPNTRDLVLRESFLLCCSKQGVSHWILCNHNSAYISSSYEVTYRRTAPGEPPREERLPWSDPIPTHPAPRIASYITAASPNIIFKDEELFAQPGVVSITPASTSFLPFFSALNASMRALSSVSAAWSVYSFLHQSLGVR